MKIRNGFVSNSSSSSFIMIGVDAQKVTKKDHKYDSMWFESDDIDEMVGIVLADDEYELDSGDMAYNEITVKFNTLAENLGVDVSDIGIRWGTRAC